MKKAGSKRTRSAAGLALMVALSGVTVLDAAWAQVPDAGTLNREIQRDVRRLQRKEQQFEERQEEQATSGDGEVSSSTSFVAPTQKGEQGPIPVWESERLPPEEQVMATPFRRIYIRAPFMKKEIQNIVRGEIIERNQLRPGALASIRSQIWNLYLQHGRLASVNFKIIPVAGSERDSYMRVEVEEVLHGRILIDDKTAGGLSESARAQIESSVARGFSDGKILDLEGLDARLKNRLRLGDYDMQISLVPVNPTLMDVKVVVSSKSLPPWGGMAQYDNTGTRSFGRDRFTFAGSLNQLFSAGDRMDLTVMKTADLADPSFKGLIFGRVDYDVPLSSYGIRLKGWGSGLHYKAVPRVSANSKANGDAFEFGFGVMKPLVTEKTGYLDVQVDYIEKFVKDRFDEEIVTGDKRSHNGRIRSSGAMLLTPAQTLRGSLALVTGSVDLSGVASALEADKLGPKVNGIYVKLEGEAAWQMVWGESNRGDFKINARGQASGMNLDSMEKFSLGGQSGLRAFSSGEASGDLGALAQFEAGYRVWEALRFSMFYDVGTIWRNHKTYEIGATAPNNYGLQDIGVGLGYAIGPIATSVQFAHQLGSNPGLSAQGRDADNGTRESRVIATVSAAF